LTFKIVGPKHFEKWRAEGRIGHDEAYWQEHDTWLDCRGPLTIHPSSRWGYNVMVITASHSLRPEDDGCHLFWPVVVEAGAWICSNTVLYNCTIGEGAVVAAGCVVRSRDVPAWTMVEGNPAMVMAEYDHKLGKWCHLDDLDESNSYYYPLPTHAQVGARMERITMDIMQKGFENESANETA
jgi:hypothetical protein